MTRTEEQYEVVLAECRALFEAKFDDYGASWRVMCHRYDGPNIHKGATHTPVQEKEKIRWAKALGELIAIVNYGLMGLVQLEQGPSANPEVDKVRMMEWYDSFAQETKALMMKKNHDFGEAWRSMRISSIADIIMQKVFRTKQN